MTMEVAETARGVAGMLKEVAETARGVAHEEGCGGAAGGGRDGLGFGGC